MLFHRFGMAVFVALGRLLIVAGVIFFFQRLIVDREVAPAIVLGLLYGGALIGIGKTFIRIGHLGRQLGPND